MAGTFLTALSCIHEHQLFDEDDDDVSSPGFKRIRWEREATGERKIEDANEEDLTLRFLPLPRMERIKLVRITLQIRKQQRSMHLPLGMTVNGWVGGRVVVVTESAVN